MRSNMFSGNLFVIVSLVMIILNSFIMSITAIEINGFDKGVSWTSVVPLKKVTFVDFDENSFLDDYSYLASIPTSVFYDRNGDRIYSYPLLYYQDPYPVKEDKERSLNARQGLDYFMEDWMSYCNGRLDGMTLINVDRNKVKQWSSRNTTIIKGDNPYDIASQIALHDWSYSDNAVLAVIQSGYGNISKMTNNETRGVIPSSTIGHEKFEMEQPTVGVGGVYQGFKIVDHRYKYLVVNATWSDPSFDIDMQIYDDQLGMVSSNAESSWKKGVAQEIGGSFIHDYGTWEIGLTAFPKKSLTSDGVMENLFQVSSKRTFFREYKVDIDISLYPGIKIDLKDKPGFGCRDAKFILKWDNPNVHLGFTVVDPSGVEVASSYSKEEIINRELSSENEKILNISMLGECRDNESYSIYVYLLDDSYAPIDFTIVYSWYQRYPRIESDCFTSATNGAVLASILNAPLLYVKPDQLPSVTKNVLFKLGVKNIYLLDIGNHLSSSIKDELRDTCNIIYYDTPEKIYRYIHNLTNSYDIVFTTIEPWMRWYVAELKPTDDIKKGSIFIGPAAYIAAHHGSPVFIVDEHPELSQAIVYHKDFWIKNARYRTEPSAGDMILSGRRVYYFLEKQGFDRKGDSREDSMETIITVAGQYNIGPTWDRTFVGKAIPGRFHFSPVDTAYWISRDIFYPALIFENPAMQGENSYINGSISKVSHLPGARFRKPFGVNIIITKPSQEEKFIYPILETFVSFAYKFNELGSKHWGTIYSRADGIIPGITPSPDRIDVDITDKKGAYYPDLSDSEVVPFYAKRSGYSNVFSTNFDKVVDNLNKGVIMWIQDAHGSYLNGGTITFWNPDSPYVYESNPWRAYEPIMLKPGHIRTFLHWLPYYLSQYGDKLGLQESQLQFLKRLSSLWFFKFPLFSERGCTENPDVALFNPHLAGVSSIVSRLSGGYFEILGAFGFMIHWDRILCNPHHYPIITTYDGMVTTSTISGSGLTERAVTGLEFDDKIKNLHSVGINTVVCLPAGTYLQMTWVRHGASYIIMDPWSTSDYCAVWLQSIIKHLAMGYTIGQAYELGMRAVGPELLVNHWWWDTLENVCFYGDPDLRVYVPSTEYSDANHWSYKDVQPMRYDSSFNINGHTPFGVTCYPHEYKTASMVELLYLIVITMIIIFLIVWVLTRHSKVI